MNCPSCTVTLKEPFIQCIDCQPSIQICLKCFAKGKEFSSHTNDHAYEIKHLSFSLFDENWNALEEIELLDELEDKGFGNWQEISKRLSDKKCEDIEDHFLKHYLGGDNRLQQKNLKTEPFTRRPINFKGSTLPPRPDGSDFDDVLFAAGYMPARGDFVVEHDNFAECDIKEVEFDAEDEDKLMTEMNVAMVDIYQSRLLERFMRKRLIKQHGLLDLASSNNVFCAQGREERLLRDSFRKFTQLLKAEEHEKLIQSILYQKYLERRIQSLQEYRRLGLKFSRDAASYEKFKLRRDRVKKVQATKLEDILLHVENPYSCQIWLQRQFTSKKSAALPQLPIIGRKPVPPLDLNDLEGVETLTEEEKKLCSVNRILPVDYLSHRSILQEEAFKNNGLKLQTARVLLKIDVNKTKKLYEFLVQQGLLKPA